MNIRILQVDAFTSRAFEGNPAGVVLDAGGLTEEQMQRIAREMNCSETAFVLPSERADLRFRYFTPAVEVDLCGHATIAALHALRASGRLRGQRTVETNAGLLQMEAQDDGTCWMEQARPKFRAFEGDLRDLVGLLAISVEDLDPGVPVGMAYTGLWDLLVPLRDRAALRRAAPNFAALAEHNRRLGVVSTHLFTRDTEDSGSTLHCRDFSPAAGVPEDPHTGTASGALGAYLVHLGALAPGRHVFEQGWTVSRPGQILVDVAEDALRVRVGGRAVTVLEGEMRLG